MDGSVMPANPGVNPSLMITALAERALVAMARGDWDQAEVLAGQAGRATHAVGMEDALVGAVQARVALHRGDVQAAREFAVTALHLPDNRSYRTYADIKRPYVVWNVVAAPEFSVEPKHWCFPIAGCVAYRGYFKEKSARKFASQLAAKGFDVTVGGVPAYSTLGKFADPVLSSMMRYGDSQLAAIIFHELSHQLLYVKNDSEFNEAFATTVEQAGLERWLASRGHPDLMRDFLQENAEENAFIELFANSREQLKKLYATPKLPASEMKTRKAEIFAQLTTAARDLQR